MANAAPTAANPGTIARGELYSLDEFRRRLKLGRAAVRHLKARGLPLIRCGRSAFVSGTKAVEFFEGLDEGAR